LVALAAHSDAEVIGLMVLDQGIDTTTPAGLAAVPRHSLDR